MLSNAPSVWYLSFYCDPRIKEIVVCKILMEARVHPLVLHIMETIDNRCKHFLFSFVVQRGSNVRFLGKSYIDP